ncbi:hypothetical protein [Arenibaculum sp.]|jgi:hypothetical protein|uniref:hypothetical protein n=1 Tax=Arenibaculum sp. TaxID=2865862 RepID=UPI002E143ADF|nr:hypothetical protein [Arenibaculum sp.]
MTKRHVPPATRFQPQVHRPGSQPAVTQAKSAGCIRGCPAHTPPVPATLQMSRPKAPPPGPQGAPTPPKPAHAAAVPVVRPGGCQPPARAPIPAPRHPVLQRASIASAESDAESDDEMEMEEDKVMTFLKDVYGPTHVPNHSGTWPPSITIRPRASFSAMRNRQAIRHLATRIFFAIQKYTQASEEEIQCMVVNGRIFVASNNNNSLPALKRALAKNGSKLYDLLTADLGIANEPRLVRATNKMKKRLDDGSHAKRSMVHGILEGVMNAALDDAIIEMKLSSGKNAHCADFIDNAAYNGKIIFISGKSAHAEQKLIWTLILAGSTRAAIIYGKKRPCRICYETLSYAQSIGCNVEFNGYPGGYWTGKPLNALSQMVKKKLNDDPESGGRLATHFSGRKGLYKVAYKAGKNGSTSVGDPGYDTESDSEAEA